MLKRKELVIFVLLGVITTVGCNRIHRQIKGSGIKKTEMRQVPSFTSISSEGAYDIDVVAQGEPRLEIEADDNVLPSINTDVKGNVLRISSNGSFSLDDEVKIRIRVPTLEGVSASGAGSITVTNLKNDNFVIDVNGAPTVRASGETKSAHVSANGAAKIDTIRLRASDVTVESNGVSNVQVFASDHLNVRVSGPSHVTYAGDPAITKTVNGPGSVEKKESRGN